MQTLEEKRAYQKVYAQTSAGKASQKRYNAKRDATLKHKAYKRLKNEGIDCSVEQYEKMLTLQVSGCSICGKTILENGKFLSVDHNHKTGQVRELLCHSCNVAIGLFKESSGLLRKAADYLIYFKNNGM